MNNWDVEGLEIIRRGARWPTHSNLKITITFEDATPTSAATWDWELLFYRSAFGGRPVEADIISGEINPVMVLTPDDLNPLGDNQLVLTFLAPSSVTKKLPKINEALLFLELKSDNNGDIRIYGPGTTVIYDSRHGKGLTEFRIRMSLRDRGPDDNYLLDGTEFSSDQIHAAIDETITEWNETDPIIRRYTRDSFPWTHYLLKGVKGYLFHVAAAGYARNHLSYQTGNISVNDKDKHRLYMEMGDRYIHEWKEWMMKRKINHNIKNAYRTLSSR